MICLFIQLIVLGAIIFLSVELTEEPIPQITQEVKQELSVED